MKKRKEIEGIKSVYMMSSELSLSLQNATMTDINYYP